MAYVFREGFAEHLDDVMALGVGSAEALRPPNEHAVVNTFLTVKDVSMSISIFPANARARV